MADARGLDADFICVAYAPGGSVRVDSMTTAYLIKEQAGKDGIFNLGTRDMNKLAIQSHLLGAHALGLENVVVLQGDRLKGLVGGQESEASRYRPTELISSIKDLNRGLDYRGRKTRGATDFCVGAVVDLGKGVEEEVRLGRRKVEAGADFILTQPVFDLDLAERFLEGLARGAGTQVVVFFGAHVLVKGGVVFSSVPEALRIEIEKGRSGVELAQETIGRFGQMGVTNIYLVAPILKGGARDYQAAQRVIAAVRGTRNECD